LRVGFQNLGFISVARSSGLFCQSAARRRCFGADRSASGNTKREFFRSLESMGGDCTGAVSVLLPGHTSVTEGVYRKITEEQLVPRAVSSIH